MEAGILQIWLSIKWLVFAAMGSGLTVIMDKTDNTNKQKFLLFIFGAIVSIIAGGASIEYFNIKGNAVQGFVYWAWGVWGMGIVIQITQQIPNILANLRDKFTK